MNVFKLLVLNHASTRSLASMVVEWSLGESRKNFLKTYHEENKLMCAHRRANIFGHCLNVTNYGDSGCQGMLVIPEGTEGEGWKFLA